jgi:hypothetical protein
MIKKAIFTLLAAGSVFALTLAGQALAAPQDADAMPTQQQGILLIQAQDNEITVAKDGTGYNIHRFSTLRLVVDAGQNDFDYFCGNTKYFIGNMNVQAGQTVTVALQPGKCEEPITTSSKPASDSLSPADYQIMWSIGNADGWVCALHATPAGWSKAQQSAYDDGYANGKAGYDVNNQTPCAN